MFALPVILNQSVIKYFEFNIPCSLWLDSSNINNFSLDINNGVITWFDRSSNNSNATRGSTNIGGTYIANILNNYGVVRFDGIDDHLVLPSSYDLQQRTRYKEYTCFMVFRPEIISTPQHLLGQTNITNNNNQNALYIDAGYLKLITKVGNNGAIALDISIDISTLVNTWIIVVWSGYNLNVNKAVFMRLNGNDNVYDNNFALRFLFENLSTKAGYLSRIGGFNTSSYYKGEIAELCYIPKALTLSTINMIEGYLAIKYALQSNLPSSHPYKNSNPIDTTNSIGSHYRTNNNFSI